MTTPKTLVLLALLSASALAENGPWKKSRYEIWHRRTDYGLEIKIIKIDKQDQFVMPDEDETGQMIAPPGIPPKPPEKVPDAKATP